MGPASSSVADSANSNTPNATAAAGSKPKGRRPKKPNKMQKKIIAWQATHGNAEADAAAHTKMKENQKAENAQRRQAFVDKAGELLATAPGRIGAGEYAAVADEIAGLLRVSGEIHISEESEKLVLDVSFMGVTAWIEETRAVESEIEAAVIESSHNVGQDRVDQLASLPVDCRDFGDVLRVLRKLAGKHWRCADVVREVRMHTIREMSQIHCKIDKLRRTAMQMVIDHFDDDRGSALEGVLGVLRTMPHFHAFLKSLLGENEIFDKLTKQSLGHELERMIRNMVGSELFTDRGRFDRAAMTKPMFTTRTKAAKILVQLVQEKWFANPDEHSVWRDSVLRYAEVKDSLAERMRDSESADAGKRLAQLQGEVGKANPVALGKAIPVWCLGALGLCSADPSGLVRMCHEMAVCAREILACYAGYRRETIEANEFFAELHENVVCATVDLRPLLDFIVDHLQTPSDTERPPVELAAETSAFIAALYDVVELTLVWNASGVMHPETYQLNRGSLLRGAMGVWWRCWKGPGRGSGSDALKLQTIMDAKPPPGFLQCRPFASARAFFESCGPGQKNHAVHDFLRLAILHIHRSNLPPEWIPSQTEVTKSFELVKSYFIVVFGRGLMQPSNRKDLERIHGTDVVRSAVHLLVSNRLNRQSSSFKTLPAKHKRHVDFVFGKLEATKVPSLLEEAVSVIHREDFDLPETHYDSPPHMTALVGVVDKLSVIESEITQSITKVIHAHTGSKHFKAVFEGKGGVRRFCRVEKEDAEAGFEGSDGGAAAEGGSGGAAPGGAGTKIETVGGDAEDKAEGSEDRLPTLMQALADGSVRVIEGKGKDASPDSDISLD